MVLQLPTLVIALDKTFIHKIRTSLVGVFAETTFSRTKKTGCPSAIVVACPPLWNNIFWLLDGKRHKYIYCLDKFISSYTR